MVGIRPSKYYHWNRRIGQANAHNAAVPKNNWIVELEREAIINYAKSHIGESYRITEELHGRRDWQIDIKYVNFKGTFLFLIDIIDGYSRFIVNHKLRMNMQEYDVQITLQKALEKFPITVVNLYQRIFQNI
jgi:transposase InsO family protein